MSPRVWALGGAFGLVALGGGVYFVGRHMVQTSPTMSRRANQPIPVMAAPATRRDLTEVIGATGEAAPVSFLMLTALVTTRLTEVRVDIGDEVHPGSLLAQFDTIPLNAAVESASAELERARGDLARAEKQLGRLRLVYEQRQLAVTDVEAAEAVKDAALSHVRASEQRLLESRTELSRAQVRSPAAAVVTERHANPGETPERGAPLFKLGRIDTVLIAAKISEEHLGRVQMGQPASVTFEAFPDRTFEGEVVRLDPVAESATRTFRAFVRLANGDLALKPGLSAFVRLQNPHPASLVVPSVALISPTGPAQSGVFVLVQGKAQFRRVRVGASAEGLTQILEGLSEGETVVTVGQLDLRDGDRVRIGDELNGLRRPGSELTDRGR